MGTIQRPKPRNPVGHIEVQGVKLMPGAASTWHGSINGHRFVIRRTAVGKTRTFQAFGLPAVQGTAPIAEAANRDALVTALVEKFKIRLPEPPRAA